MSPQTYARLDHLRRQDMLAAAARAHLVAGAPRTAPAVPAVPRPAGRARVVLRRRATDIAAVGAALVAKVGAPRPAVRRARQG